MIIIIYIGFPEEVWAKIYIKDKETNYSVSTYGNIRNDKKNKLVKQHEQNNGYYGFTISHKGKLHSFKTATLVAKTFIKNDDPKHKTQVNHKLGTKYGKKDNSIFNLEWVTPSENQQHAIANNLHKKSSKITTITKIHEICNKLQNNETISNISKETRISKRVIYDILNKVNFTNISDQYDFSKRTKTKSGSKEKYSDEIIHKLCQLWVNGKYSYEISKILNIPENTVYHIIFNTPKGYVHITSQYNLKRDRKPKVKTK